MKKRQFLIISLIVVILIPIIIYFLSVVPLFPSGGNDWAGFWGSYVGAILGGCITLWVLQRTIEENRTNVNLTLAVEKEKEEANKREKFLDDICNQALRYSTDIGFQIKKLPLYSFEDDERYNRILVTTIVLETKLLSKKNDVKYKNCDVLIGAIRQLQQKYMNISQKAILKDETVNWDVTRISFAKELGNFNTVVKNFYVENCNT